MDDLKKKLQDEITALEYELRNELPREILKAREHGDLSENAEYHAAKERQAFVNAQLGALQARLREFSMIDFSKIPRNRVGLGSRVVVLDLDQRRRDHLSAGYERRSGRPQREDLNKFPNRPRLAGQRVGDTVKIQIPGGTREMEVLQVDDDTRPRHTVGGQYDDVHPCNWGWL